MGTFDYNTNTYINPYIIWTGTGMKTLTFLQPDYDSVNCILEPDPDFYLG